MAALSTRLTASLITQLIKGGLLVALLAGIPYGLATQIGSPLPTTVPAVDQIGRLLSAPVSETMVLDLLAIALWIVWTAFLVSFVIEVAAAARGVPAPHWRPVEPLQTLAGWLVAGVTASVLVAAPAVSVAGPASPAAAATTPGPSAAGSTTPVSFTTASTSTITTTTAHPCRATAASARPAYHVAHGDWMVKVAERFLGDPNRYVDIARLNPGFESRDPRFPDHWEPGWKIVLPADAYDRGARRHATGHLEQPAPAVPPPTRTPQNPPTARPRTPAPSTPTPSTASASSATTSTSATPSGTTSPGAGGIATTPGRSGGIATTPGRSGGTDTSPSTSPSASTTTSPTAAPPNEAPEADRTPNAGHGVTLPGGWISLPLAAAVAAAAAMVWLRRRHRFRPAPLEAHRDDADLRPLPPPVARIRRVVRERAPDLLTPPARQPTVAQYARGDTDWQPPPIGPTGQQLAGISGPVPPGGLGLTGPGAHDAARALLVATLSTGSPDDPDAKGEVVIPADTLTTLLGAHAVDIGTIPRLHVTRNLPDALSHLLQLVVNRQRTLQDADADNLDTMRAADPYHPPLPPIVLLAEVPAGEQHAELTNTLYLGAALQISAVLLGEWARGDSRTLQADGHSSAHGERLSVLDVPTTVQLLQVLHEAHTGQPTPGSPVDTAADHPTRHAAAAEPASTNTPPPTPAPAIDPADAREPADSTTTPATAPAGAAPTPGADVATGTGASRQGNSPTPRKPAEPRIRIQLLGGVTILDRDGNPVRPLRQHARQLLVYLAVHRNGADLPHIMEIIWPDATLRRASERLQTEVGDLRGRIRQAAGDDKTQPVLNTGGHYLLNADLVDIDAWQLTDTLRRAAAATDPTERIAALRTAVSVHTGVLAQGFDYDWIEQPREQLRRHGIHARLHLSTELADNDPTHAADLAKAAAALDPYNEDIARQAMQALARAGDAAGIRTQLQRLRDALPEIDEEPSAETIALAADLQREISGTTRRGTGQHAEEQ